jgi:hypothetical protein
VNLTGSQWLTAGILNHQLAVDEVVGADRAEIQRMLYLAVRPREIIQDDVCVYGEFPSSKCDCRTPARRSKRTRLGAAGSLMLAGVGTTVGST